ncbi:MAG: ChaN family lipoprotein [Cyclobacteriaceae bacterium]
MRKLLLIIMIFNIPSAILAQGMKDSHWKIFQTATGKTIELPELVKATEKAQIIVFGEEHNDSLAHVVQEQLYREMLEKYQNVTLSLEMFERDVQMIIDEYLAGLITEAKLKEEGRAWSNYADYAPLMKLAKEKGQNAVAANVPGRYANMVSRKGLGILIMLDRKAKRYFSTFELPEKNDLYLKKFTEAMGNHGQHMGPQFFHAQMLRDATMAESIHSAWRKNRNTKILHLTGKFHSDEGLGTVRELKKRKKNLRVLTISCFPAEEFQVPNWPSYKNLADLIILTDPGKNNGD